MVSKLLVALFLMALSVIIHAAGLAEAMQWVRRQPSSVQRVWVWIWRFIAVATVMIVLHLCEITVWAVFYVWRGAMPDLQAALYFSAVTYTTTGYGDLVLPEAWRLVGGVEALDRKSTRLNSSHANISYAVFCLK